jgi:FkbM family methyltransferase
MRSLKTWLISVLPDKTLMHLRALDHYLNGEPELRLLRQLSDPRRPALDAGANLGIYSYFLSKRASAVFAYEPNPHLAKRLQAVLPTVRVRVMGLSDQPGERVFTVPVDSSGRLRHELGSVAQSFSGPVERFTVPCVTIDSENLPDLGFLKIDVEQHEREVLRGALQTIVRCRPVVLVEVYPLKYLRPMVEEFQFVLQHGYCAWFSFAGRWLPMENFRAQVHAAPESFGKPGLFMGNNLILFPVEHPLAGSGP